MEYDCGNASAVDKINENIINLKETYTKIIYFTA